MRYTSGLPVALVLTCGLSVCLRADVIHLKNGYQFRGSIDTKQSTDKRSVIRVGQTGVVRINRDQIALVESEAGDPQPNVTPAVARGMIQVRLKKHIVYGDGGILHGVRSTRSNDKVLVLECPGAGVTTISNEIIEKIEPYRPLAAGSKPVPTAAGGHTIPTTHRLDLKNGRKLNGNVVSGAGAADPTVMVEVGNLGALTIPKRRIETIKQAAGKIDLPPAREPAAPEPRKPPEVKEAKDSDIALPVATIDPALEEAILRNIDQLARWRTHYRRQAEAALLAIGEPAVGYLSELQHHPSWLARCSAMRIIRDVGSWNGVPLAIDGLLDAETHVRTAAAEALRTITRRDLGYRPGDTTAARRAAHRRWMEYYTRLLEASS